ncbi:hypothetical protein EDM53_00320 [Rickettsiales endosymbiont of Peranema trichophorum]|uniref:hypothetical protein n=1 Tax=Rickettsiales endosymbiont of Peranema trichophorum TaxID=2486577 RepID=UPI0010230DB0|nr:hypothetical protein [Rickettsiales endosymbiont of Peranema trichophorum]RZI47735.1 hypothetical protein EDM53_00320 [Rickettsiales endosymbiont of Peranema trichophorum]
MNGDVDRRIDHGAVLKTVGLSGFNALLIYAGYSLNYTLFQNIPTVGEIVADVGMNTLMTTLVDATCGGVVEHARDDQFVKTLYRDMGKSLEVVWHAANGNGIGHTNITYSIWHSPEYILKAIGKYSVHHLPHRTAHNMYFGLGVLSKTLAIVEKDRQRYEPEQGYVEYVLKEVNNSTYAFEPFVVWLLRASTITIPKDITASLISTLIRVYGMSDTLDKSVACLTLDVFSKITSVPLSKQGLKKDLTMVPVDSGLIKCMMIKAAVIGAYAAYTFVDSLIMRPCYIAIARPIGEHVDSLDVSLATKVAGSIVLLFGYNAYLSSSSIISAGNLLLLTASSCAGIGPQALIATTLVVGYVGIIGAMTIYLRNDTSSHDILQNDELNPEQTVFSKSLKCDILSQFYENQSVSTGKMKICAGDVMSDIAQLYCKQVKNTEYDMCYQSDNGDWLPVEVTKCCFGMEGN